jgi:Leucine rich repeat
MMTSITYQFVTLLLLISCIVCPTESRYKEKDRDRKYDKSTPYGAYPSSATVASVNLCSKNRDLKLVCHCAPDDSSGRARKAECWIFHTELMRHDPNWLTFHTQTNLEHLRIVIQSIGILKYVPTEAIRLLKQLKVLSIEYGQLEDIQPFALGNLTQLQNVTLANNQIKFVYRNAFANHAALEEIDLKDNAIVDIDQEAFVNLRQLVRLNLAKNNLTVLHDGTFQDMGNLKELNLRLNDINVLTREVFRGLGNLRFLDLSENDLSFIGDTVFAELWSLQELYLNNNNIEVSCFSNKIGEVRSNFQNFVEQKALNSDPHTKS